MKPGTDPAPPALDWQPNSPNGDKPRMRGILRQILVVFLLPKAISWVRRRYGGGRHAGPSHRSY